MKIQKDPLPPSVSHFFPQGSWGMARVSRPVLKMLLMLILIPWISLPLTVIGQTPSVTPGEIYNQDLDPVLKSIDGLTIHDRLGQQLPFETVVRTESAEQVSLGTVLDSGLPMIFNPVYFSCPMLCNLVLLERLVQEVSDLILDESQIMATRVKIEKPGALRHSRSVGVEILRERS